MKTTRKCTLVKWTGYAKPTWEPIQYIEDTEAYDKFLHRQQDGQEL